MPPGYLGSDEQFNSSRCMRFFSQSRDFLCVLIPRLETEKRFELLLENDATEVFHILRLFNFSQ